MKSKLSYSLSQIAQQCQAEVSGDGSVLIDGIGTIAGAQAGDITFLSNSLYRDSLKSTGASAVILSPEDLSCISCSGLISKNPYATYARVAQLLFPIARRSTCVHPSAVISQDVVLPQHIVIGPNVVIESGVKLGEGVVIEAGCFIGQDSIIGANSKLYPKVTLYHSTQLGERAIVHGGVVIGSDGFGMAWDKGSWIKIPQIGRVIIGNDVEIGANTTIDRGAIDNTVIEDGVKLDNQIQIAHNCHIGAHTVIAGCTGVSGSTTIGKYCRIGGGVGIVGHLKICDGVTVTGFTMVTKSITEPGMYSSGVPGTLHKNWMETLVHLRNLSDWVKRVKALEKVFKKEE